MSDPILKVRGLRKSFGGVSAVAGVDFDIAPGTIHGLMGPNGAGKSTTVNLISGVERPDEGDVEFLGASSTGIASHRMARRGMSRTFQASQIFADEDVLTNVMTGRHLHIRYRSPFLGMLLDPRMARRERTERGRIEDLLDALGLSDVARRPVGELSYGRRRLVEIARALACEPTLLILDEPAAGLTGPDVGHLRETLQALAARDVTTLVIEHNLTFMMQTCDQITVLNQGAVIADGDPASVRIDPDVIVAYLGESSHD